MGLDNYWVKPGERKSKPLDFDTPFCFEDEHDLETRRNGWAHFKGRVFEDAIEQITGVSLRACLDTATILRMADILAHFAVSPWYLPPSDQWCRGWEHFPAEAYRDIARLFHAYGHAGYELVGSW